ncbi:unnamed protein product [Clavelina lepadiformis]|uniref:Beta-adaptin appendage C-terminal subdomain domain-containing protein n=1 Tax=Clavelina lepadiformis TaxID=159417 RepID=A0ABP0FP39_CLALP
MEPLHNLQVAIKNSIDILYFSTLVPVHVLFQEDGEMERKVFLSTWKDIPASNEKAFPLENIGAVPNINTDVVVDKLKANNVFMIAKRTVEGKDMVYLSLKLPRELWVLMELKVTPGAPFTNYAVAYKCREVTVLPVVHASIDAVVRNG